MLLINAPPGSRFPDSSTAIFDHAPPPRVEEGGERRILCSAAVFSKKKKEMKSFTLFDYDEFNVVKLVFKIILGNEKIFICNG